MIEIKIGRKVEAATDICVPESFTKVSRVHAKVIKNSDGLFIEDLESRNGTFIKGKSNPISKTKIFTGQTLLFGDDDPNTAFKIDVDKIIEHFKQIEDLTRTDFCSEFNDLKKVYSDFNQEIQYLKKKHQRKSQMPRITISVVIGVILLVLIQLEAIPVGSSLQWPIMIIVMAIAGIIPFLMKQPDLKDEITDIEIKYSSKYICPKCEKPLNLNTHWRKYEANRKCPHGCGAEYAK